MDKNKALKAWEFLKSNRIATLATVSEENAPQASLVYYITDEEFHVYVISTKNSRKIANVLKNNKVALAIGQEMDPMVLQLEGTAQIIEDSHRKHDLTSRYLRVANSNTKTPNWPPITKLPAFEQSSGFVFAEITITHFKFSDFSGTDSSIIEGTPKDWI